MSKPSVNLPRFKMQRNFKLLTEDKLKLALAKNIALQNVMQCTDSNIVAQTINDELNSIIDLIAPASRCMTNKLNQPYLSSVLREEMAEAHRLLTTAISSKDKDDWRYYTNKRNKMNKNIDKAKSEYLLSKLNNNRQCWRDLKSYNGLNKACTPSKIMDGGRVVTSPKVIANIANQHYLDKISKLNKAMEGEIRDPMALLTKLIPRNQTNIFVLGQISMRETFSMINYLPNTTSTGFDSVSNRIIKKLGWSIVPQICHMINCVVRTATFPEIFKLTRIIPVSKPGKPTDNIDSFRPLNNLSALEKLVEQWIKKCFVGWLEGGNIISGDHHGERQGYSTLTAMTQIKQQISKNIQSKNYNILLTTGLSAAFDTIDHMTFLRKVEHYGVRGKEL